MFITLEGIDRSGKTTQARLLADALGETLLAARARGHRLRASGSASCSPTPASSSTRSSELLLFGAARAELVRREIRPALEAGRDVVCDRFTDSTLAYQGAARGLGTEPVEQLNRARDRRAASPTSPCCFASTPSPPAEREGDGGDRFENEGLELQRRRRRRLRRDRARTTPSAWSSSTRAATWTRCTPT